MEGKLQSLYDAHRPTLLRIAARILGSRSDAEDVVHEVFARVARHIDTLEGDARGFLIAATRNACTDELRRRHRRNGLRSHGSIGIATDAGDAAVDTVVARAVLRGLAPRERRLLIDTYSGYTQTEIAARAGMTRTAVSVALLRARQHARVLAERARGGAAMPYQVVGAMLRRGAQRLRCRLPSAGTAPFTGLPDVVIGGIAMATVAGSGLGGWMVAPGGSSALSPQATTGIAAGTIASRLGPDGPVGNAALLAGATASQLSAGGARTPPDTVPSRAQYVDGRIVQDGLLTPSQEARQEDGLWTSFTVSPDYTQDRTVYAAGQRQAPCLETSACPVVARTTDAGTTWTVLPSQGFRGGPVLLPPDFPADPTIFAGAPDGLERSDDAGATFTLAVPGAVPAAMVPSSPAGDPHVLLRTQPLTVYSAKSRSVSAGPMLNGASGAVTSLAYAPDGTLFVATAIPDPNGPSDAEVLRCPTNAPCTTVLTDPDVRAFTLLVSPGFASGGSVVAYELINDTVDESQDGGSTFRSVPVPQGNATAVFLVPRAQPPAAVVDEDPGPQAAVVESDDGGRTVHAATAYSPQGFSFGAVVVLPDRVLSALAIPDRNGDVGVRCSQDGGATWRHSCLA